MSEDYRLLLAQYRTALDAQIAILHQLEGTAERQHATSVARDFTRFAVETDRRDELMRSLLAIEESLIPMRGRIAAGQHEVESLDGFAAVLPLRKTVRDTIGRILATDRESMNKLADAELARRTALQNLDRGEATLAAYRKVLASTVASASLVDRRG